MSKTIDFVSSKTTGGHYGYVAPRSGKVFQNKMVEAKLLPLRSDDVVVDIGAYVGEFSLYCIKQGVKEVHSYEASPETYEVLKRNQKSNMFIYNLAVVGDDSPTVELFISSGIGATNSIAKTDKSTSITVDAIQYEKAVQNATVVKIDVEGAEYGYNIVQPNLRAITLEFHPIVGQDWKQRANDIMAGIRKAGFTPLYEPTFKHGFDCNGTWVR